MKLNRVAITGLGTICGLGHSTTEVWNNALDGKSGITLLERIDTTNLPINFGGEVKNFTISDDLLSPKEKDRFDMFIHFALHAANEAINDSKFSSNYSKDRIGVILGTGLGGFPYIEQSYKTFLEKGSKRVSPFFIPSTIPNMAPAMIAMKFNFTGINYAISSACASSAHALGAAASEIMLGKADIIISGGTEAVITGHTISGFASMKALSRKNEDPTKASRPFDKDRDGFVMGEGAGILVLENMEKAQARGAKIYAELLSFGASDDAFHITAPHPEGTGAAECMKQTLKWGDILPHQVGYINAHGTSTPQGDQIETSAIKQVFGSHAKNLIVNSTKSMTGHLLGAAGGLESVFCIKVLETSFIPPTINLDNPDVECDLNYNAHKKSNKNIEYALNNSFGFGGTNSSTLFKAYNQ